VEESESTFRRREDREWQTKVDHELVTLMTGHQVLSETLKRLERDFRTLDRLIRGDLEKGTDGMMASLHDVEREIRKFNAIVFVDSTGKKGLLHDVKELQSTERKSVAKWKFWTALAVAGIGTTGLLLREWPSVREFFIDSRKAIHEFSGKSSKKPGLRNATKRRRHAEPEAEPEMQE
jgi:hypothetical protein